MVPTVESNHHGTRDARYRYRRQRVTSRRLLLRAGSNHAREPCPRYCFWRKQKPGSGPPDRVESAGFVEGQQQARSTHRYVIVDPW